MFGGAQGHPWSQLARPLAGGSLAPRDLLVNVGEKESSYTLTAELAGVDPKDVVLETEGQVVKLSVTSQRSVEREVKDESGTTWHRVERSSGFNSRALRFPTDADVDARKLSANLVNGVLQVTIPKKEGEALKAAARHKVAIGGA